MARARRRETGRHERRRERIGRLALLAGGTLAALLILEVFLRVFNPLGTRLWGDRIQLARHYRNVWSNDWNPRLDRQIVFTKNSLGFRGPEPPWGQPLSVLTVGGSTTECLYLSDGKDWPAVLGRRLSTRFTRFWLNNAGMEGHSTYGHQLLLDQWVVRLRPKVVVFLVGLNDVGRQDLKTGDRELQAPLASSLRSLPLQAARHSAVVAALLNLRRQAQAAQQELLKREVRLPGLAQVELEEDYERQALARHRYFVDAYRERLRGLLATCDRAGIQPVLATQPALYGPGRDDLTGVPLDLMLVGTDPEKPENGALAWAILELYNEATRDLGRAQDVPVVDLARRLPKSSRLFYDFVHFTNEGAEAVAAILDEELCPLLAARYPEHAARPCPEAAARP
jgi:lysophospholipase L1-like esterase